MSIKEGLALEFDGDFDAAASHYRRMLQQVRGDGERAGVLLHLARALRQDGAPDDSQEALGEAQRLAKEIGDGRLQGQLALEEGELAEERGSLRYAAQQYDQAAHLLDGTAEAPTVIVKLASVERRRGEYKQALSRMRDLLREPLEPGIRAEALDELGAILIARGEYGEAVDVLTSAVELDTAANRDFAAGHSLLLLAEAHLCRGDRRKAKSLLSDVKVTFEDADSKRGMSEYHMLLGRYYEEENNFDDAAREYRAGLRLDSESDDEIGQIRARLHLAAVKRRMGDIAEAEEHLDDARSLLSGKDEDGVEWIALLTETGLLALRQLDLEDAVRRFEQVSRRATEDGDERAVAIASRHLATASRELGDLRRAEKLLLEALPPLEQRNDQRAVAELLDDLGELLIEQGRWKEAIGHLERGLSIDDRVGAAGSRAWSQLLLGRAHLQLGQRKTAGKYLMKAQQEYEDAGDQAGQAAAAYELGTWHGYQGKYRIAIKAFKKALDIQHRQSDRVGLVRTCRELSASYRRLGDLERADEYIEDAINNLGQAYDNTERALLKAERARLALAHGELDSAAQLARAARDDLSSYGLEVEAAMCLRLLSRVEASRRHYRDALKLLEEARGIFVSRDDRPELDDLYDDRAQIRLMMGDLAGAAADLQKSSELGEQMGWYHGQGRSRMLMGDLAVRRRDLEAARPHYQAALAAYEESQDEVGRSEALQRLGDWHRQSGQYDDAINAYKDARRIDQLHRDLHGLSQVSRKLGEVYLERDHLGRAAEALEQAAEYLSERDSAERAHIQLAMGRLAMARGDYEEATSHLRKAIDYCERYDLTDESVTVRRLLVKCYKMLGKAELALEHMRLLGESQAGMWQSLIEELDPLVRDSARRSWEAGAYGDALQAAFKSLEDAIRSLAHAPSTDQTSAVIRRYITSEQRGIGQFPNAGALQRYMEYVVAAFDLIRNPLAHTNRDVNAVDAAVGLCIVSFAAKLLVPKDEDEVA